MESIFEIEFVVPNFRKVFCKSCHGCFSVFRMFEFAIAVCANMWLFFAKSVWIHFVIGPLA